MFDLNTKFGRYVRKYIKSEYFVWMTTVDSTGIPQPRPVWYVWENDSFLIYSQANAYKLKHIQRNPNVSLHFNSADEKGEQRLIIVTGIAKIDPHCPATDKHRAYMRKYKSGIIGLNATPAQFAAEYSVAIRIIPTKLRGSE
jgi:PPOX class probable F420-dependent enzyme